MSRHVVLLRRDPSLGLALRALLHGTGQVTELMTIQAWTTLPAEEVSAVVVDLPLAHREQAVEEVRSRFTGRLVLVLDPTDDPTAIGAHHDCSIVQRPFEIVELWHLVTTDPAPSSPGAPSPAPAQQRSDAGPGPGAAAPVPTPPATQPASAVSDAAATAGLSAPRGSGSAPPHAGRGDTPAPTTGGEEVPQEADASTWRWPDRKSVV